MKHVYLMSSLLIFTQCAPLKNFVGEVAKSVHIQHPNIQISPSVKTTPSLNKSEQSHCFEVIPKELYIDSFQHNAKSYIVQHKNVDLQNHHRFILSFEDTLRTGDQHQSVVVYKRTVPIVKIKQ